MIIFPLTLQTITEMVLE